MLTRWKNLIKKILVMYIYAGKPSERFQQAMVQKHVFS